MMVVLPLVKKTRPVFKVFFELFNGFFKAEPDLWGDFVSSIDKDDVHDGECFESYFLEIQKVALILLCLLFGESGVYELSDVVQL
jgi:hypothetical protein